MRWWARICLYLVLILVATLILSVWTGDPWTEGLKQGSFLPGLLPITAVELVNWRKRRRARRPTRQNR
jgi:hypothetical protein